MCLGSHDLNCSNRPVRTRMPGGVGGERSGKLSAPIPIVLIQRSFHRVSPVSAIPFPPAHGARGVVHGCPGGAGHRPWRRLPAGLAGGLGRVGGRCLPVAAPGSSPAAFRAGTRRARRGGPARGVVAGAAGAVVARADAEYGAARHARGGQLPAAGRSRSGR
ncbi:hypothetical protein C8261_16555 [Pseudothauera lacus]|uniref:Uncharacterized protein n=1 Tax=Pseudothauera lacus TaxID=2136175 RepID=A0A2T4IBA0_9RHOO|nr:hypothetical protein C8261_16555 [Pseudothauera lacus]